MARLSGISKPVVGNIAGKVRRPIEDRHLVLLGALVGTGQFVHHQHPHGPLCRAIQGRVPPCRSNILAEDEGLDIPRQLLRK